MRKVVILNLALATICSVCHAEPRWCAITGFRHGGKLFYPPIARAAWIYGVVLERVIYLPDGGVQSFEFISGPRILSAGLELQMKDWSIETSASGDRECESLVIASFRLDKGLSGSEPRNADLNTPSMLRYSVEAAPLIISDPAGVIGRGPFLERVGRTIKRTFIKIFRLED